MNEFYLINNIRSHQNVSQLPEDEWSEIFYRPTRNDREGIKIDDIPLRRTLYDRHVSNHLYVCKMQRVEEMLWVQYKRLEYGIYRYNFAPFVQFAV